MIVALEYCYEYDRSLTARNFNQFVAPETEVERSLPALPQHPLASQKGAERQKLTEIKHAQLLLP
jgi:hypothetical protein